MSHQTCVQVGSRCLLLVCAAVFGLAPTKVDAVVIPPGGGPVGLPGSNKAGLVIYDELIPFEITAGPVLLYRGVLQDRVTRLVSTGKLSFNRQIRDTQAGLNGFVTLVSTSNFTGFSTDVDYDPTSLGTVAPTTASRSADGSVVSFTFDDPPVFSGTRSEFMTIATNAECFGPGGQTRIQLSGGRAVALATVRPLDDDTVPIVDITAPAPFSCACDPTQIRGSAYDPDGVFIRYRLEYASDPGGPWTLIRQDTTPVVNGVLGTWDTTPVAPQGYYFVRLSAWSECELFNSITTVMFVDKQFDILDVRSPVENGIYGGIVCFDGTIWDQCFDDYTVRYAPAGGGGFLLPVDPANPVYNTSVINDPFASWNTVATGAVDGDYTLLIQAGDVCDHVASKRMVVEIDNTAPRAKITRPENCVCVDGIVEIFGTATDANLASWTLQYTGGDANGWVTIASSNLPVVDGLLATWNTRELRPCCYTLRLLVADRAVVNCDDPHVSEYLVSVDVGGCDDPFDFDADNDGDVDLDDLSAFILHFTGPLP